MVCLQRDTRARAALWITRKKEIFQKDRAHETMRPTMPRMVKIMRVFFYNKTSPSSASDPTKGVA